MKTHRKESVALASISLAAIFGAASCNALLGIDGDEYRDVAVDLCGCSEASTRFSDCQERVRSELVKADEETRERWLGNYDSKGCRSCDREAVESCLQSEPTCRRPADRCSEELDCCGALEGKAACLEGRCRQCRSVGEDCTQSADCCGSIADPGGVYCHAGKCVAEAPGCLETFETCSASSECCGFEAVLDTDSNGRCVRDPTSEPDDPNICFEPCLPNSVNCPGCCGRADNGGGGTNVCLDGPRFATALVASGLSLPGVPACEQLCELAVDESCPLGTRCVPTPFFDGVLLHLCVPAP
jgi:hypothetical protein